MKRAAAWTLLALLTAGPLGAARFSGVTLPDTMPVGGRTLRLNGAALLKKMVFKVYVAALYIEEPSKDAEAIVAAEVPKAFVLHFLRDVPRDQLAAAIVRGIANNAGEVGVRAKPEVDRLLAALVDMKGGDRLTLAYDPENGSTVTTSRGTTLALPGKDFADSFLLLYLGPRPPRQEMKKGLLGGA